MVLCLTTEISLGKGQIMARVTITISIAAWLLLAGVGVASDTATEPVLQPQNTRSCEPILPILELQVPADTTGDGIRSCEVVTSPDAWDSFCTDNSLPCDVYGEDFFKEWTIVAVVIETISPTLCDNAGSVPAWEVSCLRGGRVLRARVSETLSGADCRCSMGPQFPTLLFLVNAVDRKQASVCRAWREIHTIECLFP